MNDAVGPLWNLAEVQRQIGGRSRARIYADIKDGKFPRPIQTGERSVAWVASEVEEWKRRRVEARNAKHAALEGAPAQ